MPHENDPYQAPQSNVIQEHQVGAGVGEITGPHSVPAGNGWSWIANGFWHFKQNPGTWIGVVVIWLVLLLVLALIPLIGSIATILLMPVLMGGILLGAQAQADNKDLETSHLFAGFSKNTGDLVLVGVLYSLGVFVMVLVIALLVGGLALVSGVFEETGDLTAALAMIENPVGIILFVLIIFGLSLPIVMAYWFAPVLVVLHNKSAIEAMKLSFKGCLKNILPFLVYGVVGILLYIVAIIPLGLGLLVIGPVFMASIYTSYRDIYVG